MTFGSLSQSALPGSFIPYGGNFYASDYTISLWLDTSSLTEGTQTTLFGYYGSNAGQKLRGKCLVSDVRCKLGMGDGNLNTSTGSFSQNRGDVSEASVVLGGGLLNVTLAATGANQSQSVDVYVNGSLLDTLSYNGNMNGNRADIQGWINPNLTWGGIQWTDAKLSAEQIAGLPAFRFRNGLGFSGNPGPGRSDDAPPFLTVFHQRTGKFIGRCLKRRRPYDIRGNPQAFFPVRKRWRG